MTTTVIHDTGVAHAPQQPPGWPEPLRLTTGRWLNCSRRVRDSRGERTEKWAKVLAHRGSYDQFRYGCDHPSRWDDRGLQRCIICSFWSQVIGIDVDVEQWFAATRTARHIGREHALTIRGWGFHVLVDARGVPEAEWPRQVPIAGADIKSCGFLPWPGSWHWSGDRYEPVPGARPVPATPQLIAAIIADQADARGVTSRGQRAGGHGGAGGGHDGEVAASVLRDVRRGYGKEKCYRRWRGRAVPRDPSWAFTRADFERHYGDPTRGAVRKAAERRAREAADLDAWLAVWPGRQR